MDINKAHQLISQGLQKNGVFAYLDIGHDEIDLHMMTEQLQYIKDIVRAMEKPQDGLDKDSINFEILRPLTVVGAPIAVSTLSGYGTGSKTGTLAYSDIFLPIKCIVGVSKQCRENGQTVTKTKTVRARLVSNDDIDNMLEHDIYKPTYESPLATIIGNTINIYTDGNFTVTSALLHYVKYPTDPKWSNNGGSSYHAGTSVQIAIGVPGHDNLVDRTIARIKSISEGNPLVIQRIDQKQTIN